MLLFEMRLQFRDYRFLSIIIYVVTKMYYYLLDDFNILVIFV